VGLDIVKMYPLPSSSSHLPSAVDVTTAMLLVSDHQEGGGTPGMSDCEYAYAGRATERLLRQANHVALPKELSAKVPVSGWLNS
jgi:hypothetical protein